jgi:hypothetical protein
VRQSHAFSLGEPIKAYAIASNMALDLLAGVIFAIDASLVHLNRFSHPHEICL